MLIVNSVWASCLMSSLKGQIHLAAIAGLHLQMQGTQQGLIIKLWGIRETYPVLLRKVLELIHSTELTLTQFEESKESVRTMTP